MYVSIYASIHLFFCLSLYLSIRLSVYPSIRLSVYPSIYLSISIYLFLSIYPIYLIYFYLPTGGTDDTHLLPGTQTTLDLRELIAGRSYVVTVSALVGGQEGDPVTVLIQPGKPPFWSS